MRVFAERALAEGKRQGKTVTIALGGNNITYTVEGSTTPINEPLSGGFTKEDADPDCVESEETLKSFNDGEASEFKIGISGITAPGYFAACGARNYCAAAVKTKDNNSFIACVRRGASASWEAL